MRAVLILFQAFLASFASATQFSSFNPPSTPSFGLPKNVDDEQQPASKVLMEGIKSITEIQLKNAFRSLPENVHLKMAFIEFKIFAHKLKSLQFSPACHYLFLRRHHTRLVQHFSPKQTASTTKLSCDSHENCCIPSKVTPHCVHVHEDHYDSNDFRMSQISQLHYTLLRFKERLESKGLPHEVFLFFVSSTSLQLQCIEESVNLNMTQPTYRALIFYIKLVSMMLPLFMPKHEVIDSAIDEIICLYDNDLMKLSRCGLGQAVPEDLSKEFVLLFASNTLLKASYGVLHHDMCKLARFMVFQTKLDVPTAGCYKSMKDKLNLCAVMDTYPAAYPDLNDRIDDIIWLTEYDSRRFIKAWIPDAPLPYKMSVIYMHATLQYANEILDFAFDSINDGSDEEALEFAYHALLVILLGLSNTAQHMMKPAVVNMLKLYLKTPDTYDQNQYRATTTVLLIYENNFAALRETHPDLADSLFHTIETCRTLNYTLYCEVCNHLVVTQGEYELCQVAAWSYHFLNYIAEPIEKVGMLSDMQFINKTMYDAILTFRSIKEENSLGDNASMMIKNFLVQSENWLSNTGNPEILKQIPESYKNPMSRRKNFSLEAILKRTKEAEEKEMIEASRPKKVERTVPKPLKLVKKKQANSQKTKVKKTKKRRGFNEIKKQSEEKTEASENNFASDLVQDDNVQVEAEMKSDTIEVVEEVKSQVVAEIKCDGSASSDSDSKPSKLSWQKNSSTTLFNERHIAQVIDSVKVKETLFEPTHISAITGQLGYTSVKADPRDVAMSLIIIGERIWKGHFEPLQEALRALDLGPLIQLFHYSLDKFEQEMNLLHSEDQCLYEDILRRAHIKDSKHLALCLKFYRQRVAVAHPHIPRLPTVQHKTALRHFFAIARGNRSDASLVEYWKRMIGCDDHIGVKPISSENRSKGLLDTGTTEYAISFIFMHEMFPCEKSLLERNSLAHKAVANKVYFAYLDHIFPDHHDLEFLKKL